MANYCCTIRTNYFRVKDEAEFRELMSRAYGTEDSIELWEGTDPQGNKVFGFGLEGSIAGVKNAQCDGDDDLDETAYDEFIDGLQRCVADDDAIIIMEAGYEKLCYVVGAATIITSKDYEHMSITDLAMGKAAEMLGAPAWTTTCDY